MLECGGKSSDRRKNAKLEVGFSYLWGVSIESQSFTSKQVEKYVFSLIIKII